VLLFRLGAMLENLGTVPLIEVSPTTPHIFGFFDFANGFSDVSTAPACHIADGGFAGIFMGFCSRNTLIPPNMFSGGAGAFAVVAHDSSHNKSFPLFTAGYAGTEVNSPLGQPGGSGPSANRPLPVIWPIPTGCVYQDTDLGKPIFWDGAQWTDALGVAV
jgi:hypothetical protein